MSKLVIMVNDFLLKSSKFCLVRIILFCSNHQFTVKTFIKGIKNSILDFNVSNSNGNMEELERKI